MIHVKNVTFFNNHIATTQQTFAQVIHPTNFEIGFNIMLEITYKSHSSPRSNNYL